MSLPVQERFGERNGRGGICGHIFSPFESFRIIGTREKMLKHFANTFIPGREFFFIACISAKRHQTPSFQCRESATSALCAMSAAASVFLLSIYTDAELMLPICN